MMRPPVPYFGGKQLLADAIVSYLPAHEHYVEPFAGGLSVLLAKGVSAMETVNDLDGDIVAFWRVLRDRPDDLARACALTPHARAELAGARERGDVDEVERARRVWVCLTQGRGGQLMRTGWRFNIAPGRSPVPMIGYLDGYLSRMPQVCRRLRRVSLECRPALEVIEAYGACPGVLLYVDPPYLGRSRGSTTAYRHEMRDEASHRELADALTRCAAAVVLSGYPDPVYDDLYAGWDRVELRAHTGQGNNADPRAGARDGARTEVLWSNRTLARQGVLDLDTPLVRAR